MIISSNEYKQWKNGFSHKKSKNVKKIRKLVTEKSKSRHKSDETIFKVTPNHCH